MKLFFELRHLQTELVRQVLGLFSVEGRALGLAAKKFLPERRLVRRVDGGRAQPSIELAESRDQDAQQDIGITVRFECLEISVGDGAPIDGKVGCRLPKQTRFA